MPKKTFFIIALLLSAAMGVAAQTEQRISAGIGGYFTNNFGGGAEASIPGFGKTGSITTSYDGGGGFVYMDVVVLELSVGFFAAGGTWEERENISGLGLGANFDTSVTGLDFSLFGKYPFAIGSTVTLFPLAGVTCRYMLSATLDGRKADKPEDFSALWFKFGGGVDYSFTDRLYLRTGILYGIRLANRFEKDIVDFLNSVGQITNWVDARTLLGHGLEIKLAIGHRF